MAWGSWKPSELLPHRREKESGVHEGFRGEKNNKNYRKQSLLAVLKSQARLKLPPSPAAIAHAATTASLG